MSILFPLLLLMLIVINILFIEANHINLTNKRGSSSSGGGRRRRRNEGRRRGLQQSAPQQEQERAYAASSSYSVSSNGGIASIRRGMEDFDEDECSQFFFTTSNNNNNTTIGFNHSNTTTSQQKQQQKRTKIVLAGPFSLQADDKYYFVGNKMRSAYGLVVDYVNRERCGIALGGNRYPIELRSYDDGSSIETTAKIAQKYLVSNNSDVDVDVDVVLAGLASDVTRPLADIVYQNRKTIMISGGAAVTSIFSGRDTIFTTLPPSDQYLTSAMEALKRVGATSIAAVWDDHPFTRAACGVADTIATNQFGMNVTSTQQVEMEEDDAAAVGRETTTTTSMTTIFEPIVTKLSKENPDVVFTCTYHCVEWMKALRNINWSPKAQVFTICVGSSTFANQVGPDAEYIFGVTPWSPNHNDDTTTTATSTSTSSTSSSSRNRQHQRQRQQRRDALTGWTSSEFAKLFQRKVNAVDVAYQAAAAAGAISTVLQAIEGANTTDPAQLAQYMLQTTFPTMYQDIVFDENGQTKAPMLLVQTDSNLNVQTVFPFDHDDNNINETTTINLVYPMPSWDRRDCLRLAPCGKQPALINHDNSNNDTCSWDGHCICGNPDLWIPWGGAGKTARCVPTERMQYIQPTLLAFGYVFVVLVLVMSCFASAYVHRHRTNPLITVSQPIFLYLIIIGSVVSVLSIIPMGAQTGYRATSPNIEAVDAACMAVPWLWGIGFAITFSALFAKVWRVKKIYRSSINITRQQVSHYDVLPIFLVMITIETAILLAFQIVSPQRWERKVATFDDLLGGYPLSSAGYCYSDYGWWFYLALVIVNILCMFYALVLCFQTKDIPSDFAEGTHIFLSVMFMFQILVLAVPVLAIVQDDVDAFYFVRAIAVFLQSFTVLVIIFLPKMIRIYRGEDTHQTIRDDLWAAMQSARRVTRRQQSSDFEISISRVPAESRSRDGSSELFGIPIPPPTPSRPQQGQDVALQGDISNKKPNFAAAISSTDSRSNTSGPLEMPSLPPSQSQPLELHHDVKILTLPCVVEEGTATSSGDDIGEAKCHSKSQTLQQLPPE